MRDDVLFDAASLPPGWCTRRLRLLASINDAKLLEDTPPDRVLRYMDISSVRGDGSKQEPQVVPFEDAPSRARRLARAGDTAISTVRTYLKAIT
jgi:type I restriction enzyme S subunit